MEGRTGIKVLWYRERNTTNIALRNKIGQQTLPTNVAPWGIPINTAGGNGTKRPKTRPSETTPYRDRLSTIITLRE